MTIRESERLLVRHADTRPEVGCLSPLTGEHEPVGLSHAVGNRAGLRAGLPKKKLAVDPRRGVTAHMLQANGCFACNAIEVPAIPRLLGARSRDAADAVEFTRGQSELERLIQQPVRTRVIAAQAYESKCDQDRDALLHAGDLGALQQLRRRPRGFCPLASFEFARSVVSAHIGAMRKNPSFLTVSHTVAK